MTVRTPAWLALVAVVLLATAVSVAVLHLGRNPATIPVAALSSQDRAALLADRDLVASLPTALAQVPVAASDATGGRLSQRRAMVLLRTSAALRPLANAVASPTTATATLTSSYREAMAGREVPDPDRLTAALAYLQTVEGEVVPAVRLAAAKAKRPRSAGSAFAAVVADRRAPALARLIGSWQQVYGAFVLVGQRAAG